MRTYLQMNLRVSNDDDQLDRIVDQLSVGFDDNDDTRNGEATVHRLLVAPSTVDSVISLGGVTTAHMLYVRADQLVSVKLNNSNVALDVEPTPAAADGVVLSQYQKLDQPGILMLRGRVTSLSISNPSAVTAAVVTIIFVGV